MTLKGLIFDMDGLLINSENIYSEATKRLLADKASLFTLSLKRKMMGRDAHTSLSILKEACGLSESIEELMNQRHHYYWELFQKDVNLLPGAEDIIQRGYQEGLLIALATSSQQKYADYVLDRFELRQFFSIIVTGDHVTKGKPDPEIFLKVLAGLELDAESCVVFEDSENGVNSAYNAGIRCVAVPNEFTKGFHDYSRAVLVLESLNDVDFEQLKAL